MSTSADRRRATVIEAGGSGNGATGAAGQSRRRAAGHAMGVWRRHLSRQCGIRRGRWDMRQRAWTTGGARATEGSTSQGSPYGHTDLCQRTHTVRSSRAHSPRPLGRSSSGARRHRSGRATSSSRSGRRDGRRGGGGSGEQARSGAWRGQGTRVPRG
eukprot:scaffold75006_cov36-Tisochrysis_lutea.AAC.11